MDLWKARLLIDWIPRFGVGSGLDPRYILYENLIAAFTDLQPGDETFPSPSVDTFSSVETVSSVVICLITRPRALDDEDIVEILLFFLLHAAKHSLIDKLDIAKITLVILVEGPPYVSLMLRHGIRNTMRQKLTAPSYPEDRIERCIETDNWVALNTFFACLTRLDVFRLVRWATRDFDCAFCLPNIQRPPNMLAYHVPAAAAWITHMGARIRMACMVGTGPKYFSPSLWLLWKEGFGNYRNLESLSSKTRQAAEKAWQEMNRLETIEM